MGEYSLFGKFTVKDGERDALVEILLEATQSMKNVEECTHYHVHVSDDDPNAVYVYEVWKNADAHQASLALESTQILIQRAKPIIAGIERISTLQPRGGKGL
ncbi:antibiotic biosynthesis monooxygenase [Brevibacillus panacihumi W25]|uniref:Antibiotic biosynthesis monooxygenase n=1 Tax=Brevibacillus panacihumi W25 TaxID=1408254 RepID=V6M0A1_9BACL|nr:putative quinol monooxygenase [Brevibacillus panacihumi]EST52034.1 antibiotic biosynthesis monooxygenase [Brevibacillus panacihumi W25]